MASVPAAVPAAPVDMAVPYGGGSGRWAAYRAPRKYTRLLGGRNLCSLAVG